MAKNHYNGVDSYAVFFVSCKVKMLIRTPFFQDDDYEDLEQELILTYLLAEPHYDSQKGHRKSFIKAVINNKAKNILFEAERQKRWSGQNSLSLSTPLTDGAEAHALCDVIPDEDRLWNEGISPHSAQDIELNIDMQKRIEAMPEEMRSTYELLKEHSIADASRIAGIPRTTLSSRAQKLRKYIKENP